MPHAPAVFYPYRTLGLYADVVPLALECRAAPAKHYAAVAIGRDFHIYDATKLSIVAVGGPAPAPIEAIAICGESTITSAGQTVSFWRRAALVQTLRTIHDAPADRLLALDDAVVSLSSQDSRLQVWGLSPPEPRFVIDLGAGHQLTAVLSPPARQTQLLVGTRSGTVHWVDLIARSHQTALSPSPDDDLSAVTVLAASPAFDIIGCGHASGAIRLIHLAQRAVVLRLCQDEGPVTALSFRTDDAETSPHLVSASASDRTGTLVVWDLRRRAMAARVPAAHDGPITSAVFFDREPVLLTAGADNAVRTWVFDPGASPGEPARPLPLRARSGHAAPATCVDFYHSTSSILSASLDRTFRVFSAVRESHNRELSQGRVIARRNRARKRAAILDLANRDMARHLDAERSLRRTPMTGFRIARLKQHDWESIVSCHQRCDAAVLWSKENARVGRHLTVPGDRVLCAAVSACGHFAVVGTAGGGVFRFNIQSAAYRGALPAAAVQDKGHEPVVGVVTDALNAALLTATLGGHVTIWDLDCDPWVQTAVAGAAGLTSRAIRPHHAKYALEAPVAIAKGSPDARFAGVATQDAEIRFFDMATGRLLRTFIPGSRASISDFAISRDGLWVVAAAMDATLRVWDVPSGACVNYLRLPEAATGVALSPQRDMLATTHVGERGVRLWLNKMVYGGASPFLAHVDERGSEPADIMGEDATHDMGPLAPPSPAPPLPSFDRDYVCNAANWSTKWRTLIDLDAISERNRPIKGDIEDSDQPAPFFLPSAGLLGGVAGLGNRGDEPSVQSAQLEDTMPTPTRCGDAASDQNALLAAVADFDRVPAQLIDMSPQLIDYLVQSLHDPEEIAQALEFCCKLVEQRTHFDMAHAIADVVLRRHAEVLAEAKCGRIDRVLAKLQDVQAERWQGLESLFHQSFSMISVYAHVAF